MNTTLARSPNSKVLTATGNPILPAIIADAGEHAARRFIEFFTAAIRNVNTRRAYAKAVADFLAYCLHSGLTLPGIEPVHVAAYIEQLTRSKAAPTVKQHLAAISMLFDWLTTGGVIAFNPAASAAPSTSSHAARRPCLPLAKPDSSSTASTPAR
jgi:integrase/recombinase XerD